MDPPSIRLDLSGDHSATICVTRADGSKAAGERWELRFRSDRNASGMAVTYGDPPRERRIASTGVSLDIVLASGDVSSEGLIELRGLPGGEEAQPLHLTVGNRGYLGFCLPDENKTHESFTLELAADLKAGDRAPTMEVTRLADGSITKLPTEDPKIRYIEFWGVHCGPCQKPLQELDDLARRRGPEWRLNVQLASVCLDPIADVRRHIEKKKLLHVEHFVPTGGHPSGGTPNAFGVSGVPRAFLIDAAGIIVWAGHPTGFDVEQEIERLLIKQS